jgi:hypothetical protein
MNYLALLNFQRIIFSILFILSGLYLIIFFLKEIIMLFIPRKHNIQDLAELLANDKNIKIIPLTTTTQPEATVKKEININKPKVIKKEKYIKSPTTSPSVKVKKEKVKRKSRKRTHDI